jgi:oligoendopeptidase F
VPRPLCLRALADEAAGPAAVETLPPREAIPEADRWRVEDIFPTDAAWEEAFRALEADVGRAAAFRGRLGEGPQVLLEALRAQDDMGQRLERLYAYAFLRRDEDARVGRYQEMGDRVARLATAVEAAWAFFDPEVLALPEEALRGWLANPPSGAEGLAIYRHRLDNLLRQKPHVLSPAEEALLARVGELARAPETAFDMLNDADIRFPTVRDEAGREVELTKARYLRFLESHDRRVRRDAFEALYATYGRHRNTLGALLGASVRRDWFYAETRRYPSSLAMALDADNVPVAVYDQLVAAVRAHLGDLHRYLRLRRRVLGLERLHMYDLYVPLVRRPERHIPYPEAVRTVEAGLRALGEEYVRRYRDAIASRWVDVYENQGKAGGAYSWGVYGVHPFVLLNYQGTVDHVFTIAHEFGHALHSQLAQETQPYPYAGHSIFVAEVASTVNEALLMHHLLQSARDREERAYLVNHYLEEFRGTVFRQVMFAEFERRIHEVVESGGALTADNLSSIYRELNLAYYGAEVEVDPEIDLEWARIPHFYRAFYVYKYATGFSAAQALAEAVRREGEPAVRRYLDFLRSGSSKYPVDLLREAGVDMTRPEPVERALGVFAELVGELERLLA